MSPITKALFLVFPALLCACGGSDSQNGASNDSTQGSAPTPAPPPPAPPPPPPSYGVYGARLTGSNNQDIVIFIDGTIWGVYGTASQDGFQAAGLIASWDGVSTPTHFSAALAVDFGTSLSTTGRATTLRVDLNIDESIPSINGVLASSEQTLNVTGGPMFGSGFDRNAAPDLQSIQGSWTLVPARGRTLALDISATGAISGTAGTCSLYQSTVAPVREGKNFYSVILKFREGNFGCNEPYGSSDGVRGYAVVYPLADGRKQLVIGAWNGWDPVWLAASGKR